jgi:hypothetical protein
MPHSDHGVSAASGEPRADDTLRLPILVGFTGRRVFSGDAAENAHLLDIVAARFRRLVQWLDRELPLTPKLLICGGDAGADLAVTTAVLAGSSDNPEHPLWSVALVTAYAGYAPDAATVDAYAELKAAHPDRIATRRLRHLLAHHVEDTEPDEAERVREHPPGPEASEEERDHFRGGHFEQHALWLARYATLLVAASAAGTAVLGPAKAGATARAVAYRRAAVPDEYGAAVIERSQELLAGSPLDEPDGGHVLWIDPGADNDWPAKAPPLQVLKPVQMIFDQRQAVPSLETARDAIYREPFSAIPAGGLEVATTDRRTAIEGALVVSRQFEDLHACNLPRWLRPFWTASTRGPKAAYFAEEPPHLFLKQLRDANAPIGRQQLIANSIVRWALRWLIGLFLLAVVCYESYLELWPRVQFWLLAYVALLTVIAVVAAIIAWLRVARLTEDLRGLREILRVQIVWWASGLVRVLDQVHLRSIDNDLKIIREVAATISTWAILRNPVDDTPRRLQPNFDEATRWIREQVNYHDGRRKRHQGFKRLSQQGSVIGLGTALLSLMALLAIFKILPPQKLNDFDLLSIPRYCLASALALWIFCTVVTGANFTRQFTGESLFRWPRGRWETGSAILLVISALGLLAVAIRGDALFNPNQETWARAILATAVFMAVIVAWAVRMKWRTKDWNVPRMSRLVHLCCMLTSSGFLLGLSVVLAPALAPCIGYRQPEASAIETFRALMLTGTTLLLAASGMLRYYVEKRNHAAQAIQSDDCHRAFLRAQATLQSATGTLGDAPGQDAHALRRARAVIVEISKLALDENEAWLRAHRERPVEAISGA